MLIWVLCGQTSALHAARLSWCYLMGQSAVDSLQVLTAGIDGQLHLLPLDWDPDSAASTSQTCYSDQQGYISYHAAQWSSMDTFVTASTTGNLPLRLSLLKHVPKWTGTHSCLHLVSSWSLHP